MLVVIIIIAIVASIGANTYQKQRAQVRYNDSILTVLEMIKTARNYAVTSRPVFDTCAGSGNESYVPAEGYGVYIERSDTPGESRVVLFANTETDENFEASQFDEVLAPCASDLPEEIYFLPLDTVFVDLLTAKDDPATTPADESAPLSSDTNVDEDEVVIIFRPPLAESTLAANDHPVANLTEPNDLYLEFKREGTPAEVPSRYIHINKVAGFPEIE
jgi:hypothetical protein